MITFGFARTTASLILIFSFATPLLAQSESDGQRAFEQWRARREQSLRSETGYLALAGLYWLKDGRQSFGSAPQNDILFPAGRAPEFAGFIDAQEFAVTLESSPEATMTVEGTRVSKVKLVSDSADEPTRVQLGELTFWLIDRSGRLGIRLRDPQSPVLRAYQGTKCFPFSTAWQVPARYEPLSSPETIAVPSILGTESQVSVEGRLTFEIDGQSYALYPTSQDKDRFSFVFGDKTNGEQTHGGGRFLSVPRPADGDVITIDFNRAYNPPCAYSPYTTCPMTPKQNMLPIRVEAGETTEGIHH